MVRKIVACVLLIFAVVVLASIAPRLTTFSVTGALAIVSILVGVIGAIGLFRTWPHAHLMAGVFPLVIAGLSVWNAMEMLEPDWCPEDIAAIVVGLLKALELPSDWRSTIILAPLSLKIRQVSDAMLAVGYRSLAEREFVAEQASITSQLLLANALR